MGERKSVFLLRAFGDFLIAVNMASRNRLTSEVNLIASTHLEPLYNALNLKLPSNINLHFHDFRIRNGLFGCFTNRFMLRKSTISELLALRRYMAGHSANGTYYMESSKRLLLPKLVTGYPFRYLVADQHVYDAYASFFSADITELENISLLNGKQNMKVLVVPEARQARRVIGPGILQKIKAAYGSSGIVTIAYFKEKKDGQFGNSAVYQSFSELMELISAADLVIGSDSMPVHMAQWLGKPHYILHPESVKDQFFTPFSLKHHTHMTFEDINERKTFLPDA